MSVHLQDVSALSPMPPPRDHNSTASIKRRPRPQHRATRNGRKVTGTCKTCTPCRAKKVSSEGDELVFLRVISGWLILGTSRSDAMASARSADLAQIRTSIASIRRMEDDKAG